MLRCAEGSTDAVLQTVNVTPGAIGYAEAVIANHDSQSQFPGISLLRLNGQAATPQAVGRGLYGFWNVEYLYTYGKPATGSLLQAFFDFVDTDAAISSLKVSGDIPCSLIPLCSQPGAPTSGAH